MDITEVSQWIRTHASKEDIESIYEAAKDRNSRLTMQAQLSFNVGDIVSFQARRGKILTGKVKKLLQKNVTVEVPEGRFGYPETWRVNPSLLTKVNI